MLAGIYCPSWLHIIPEKTLSITFAASTFRAVFWRNPGIFQSLEIEHTSPSFLPAADFYLHQPGDHGTGGVRQKAVSSECLQFSPMCARWWKDFAAAPFQFQAAEVRFGSVSYCWSQTQPCSWLSSVSAKTKTSILFVVFVVSPLCFFLLFLKVGYTDIISIIITIWPGFPIPKVNLSHCWTKIKISDVILKVNTRVTENKALVLVLHFFSSGMASWISFVINLVVHETCF